MIEDLPKIVVKEVIENEDGSANMELDLDSKEAQLLFLKKVVLHLLDIGLTRLLEEHSENNKHER